MMSTGFCCGSLGVSLLRNMIFVDIMLCDVEQADKFCCDVLVMWLVLLIGVLLGRC